MLTSTSQNNYLNIFGFFSANKKRLNLVLQSEAAECGLACLAMVANYHGYKIDLLHLRKKFSSSLRGINLKTLDDYAISLGFNTRALRVDPHELRDVHLPCILHWENNHFVILSHVNNGKYTIMDPAIGEKVLSEKEFNLRFTGVLLELEPRADFVKGEMNAQLKLSDFWARLTGLKITLAKVLGLSLLLEAVAVLSPYYLQMTVDKILVSHQTSIAQVIAAGFFMLLLLQLLLSGLRGLIILNLSSRLSLQMSANLFYHLIRLPLNFFISRHVGDLVSRFGSLGHVRDILASTLVATLIDGLLALITLLVMFFYSPLLSLFVVAAVFLYVLSRIISYKPFKVLNEEILIASAKENTHFIESMRAVQAIKIFQKEKERQQQWQHRLVDVLNKQIKISHFGISFGLLNGFIFGAENILVIYFATQLMMDQLISLGMFYAFLSYKMSFIHSVDKLVNQAVQYKLLDVHLNRLSDIAFTEKENLATDVDAPLSHPINQPITGKIRVENLSYRFSEQTDYLFKDINFEVLPGESLAITGPSGCGKSTLLKCLMGLIPPTSGTIYIDDQPLENLPHYRSQIAAVMQDDQLISGDIADNISFFSPDRDLEKLKICAAQAAIYDEISQMPMAFNTLVGDMGSTLSGGQKQRVILARALYREPRILFMDEATSHLDVNNEALVNQHINQLAITRILVAHRAETVMCAGKQINLADFNKL